MTDPDSSDAGDRARDKRDAAGELRDEAAAARDLAGDRRDRAGELRDEAGDLRDRAGARRDRAAERRDLAAAVEEPIGPRRNDRRASASAQARRRAAADRSHASEDRGAGAAERARARADRGAGAGERADAARDRDAAGADRRASASDRELVLHDALTGVHLRGPGIAELEREIDRAGRSGAPLVLAFADVDGLKLVNDSLGHAAGDLMLVAVAAALRANLRSHDLVIRYGGDEFVCVIAGLDLAAAAARLALVHADLEKRADPTSVTVGLAEWRPGESALAVLARADADLYRRRAPGQRG